MLLAALIVPTLASLWAGADEALESVMLTLCLPFPMRWQCVTLFWCPVPHPFGSRYACCMGLAAALPSVPSAMTVSCLVINALLAGGLLLSRGCRGDPLQCLSAALRRCSPPQLAKPCVLGGVALGLLWLGRCLTSSRSGCVQAYSLSKIPSMSDIHVICVPEVSAVTKHRCGRASETCSIPAVC